MLSTSPYFRQMDILNIDNHFTDVTCYSDMTGTTVRACKYLNKAGAEAFVNYLGSEEWEIGRFTEFETGESRFKLIFGYSTNYLPPITNEEDDCWYYIKNKNWNSDFRITFNCYDNYINLFLFKNNQQYTTCQIMSSSYIYTIKPYILKTNKLLIFTQSNMLTASTGNMIIITKGKETVNNEDIDIIIEIDETTPNMQLFNATTGEISTESKFRTNILAQENVIIPLLFNIPNISFTNIYNKIYTVSGLTPNSVYKTNNKYFNMGTYGYNSNGMSSIIFDVTDAVN